MTSTLLEATFISREWAISVVGEKGCVGGWVCGGEVRKCMCAVDDDEEEEGRNRTSQGRKENKERVECRCCKKMRS